MMRKILSTLIVGTLATSTALAQPPNILWTHTFGGSNYDQGYSVQQTTDGGYIIAGYTDSYGAGYRDVYLIKTDASGNQEWDHTFGGLYENEGYSVQQTSDGGYIISGYTDSYGVGYDDVYLIKTDAQGIQVWTRSFGEVSSDDFGYSVQQTSDGGYIIAGWTESYGAGGSDVYLIKTDSGGSEEWYQTFGGSSDDNGESVRQTTDGGYIIAGYTASYGAGEDDIYLIKTDASGNLEWDRTFGGSSEDRGFSVQQTTDGGYIIAGWTESYGDGGFDVYLIKTYATGDTMWTRTFGGANWDFGRSVQQTSDGGYIIAGSSGGNYLIKTDAWGNEEWSQTFGGSGGESVQQTSDGGYIFAGHTGLGSPEFSDVWLMRLESETGVTEQGTRRPLDFVLHPVYPNPFNPAVTFRIELPVVSQVNLDVFDLAGRKAAIIFDGIKTAGYHDITFDGSELASGIYIYRLEAGEFSAAGKMVLMK